eukprot:TRINITY_DN105922_c0_g1_i1.p1 TRINITY_DN105922_c0_g1~~TRINITY_DN105922_c0_g1_i1.p1  ORF type:complete len:264 (+),score=-24.22 TRINITY_DN105922_c0_g1_i1:28-819(+)
MTELNCFTSNILNDLNLSCGHDFDDQLLLIYYKLRFLDDSTPLSSLIEYSQTYELAKALYALLVSRGSMNLKIFPQNSVLGNNLMKKSLPWLLQNTSNPNALWIISQCYDYGLGVNVNKELAYNYDIQGANYGHAGCITSLGTYHRDVKNDINTARIYFKQAANKGYVPGISCLGASYSKSNDYHLAEKFYKVVADIGYSPAQEAIGYLYETKLDNLFEAMRYYELSARQGSAFSSKSVSMLRPLLKQISPPTSPVAIHGRVF